MTGMFHRFPGQGQAIAAGWNNQSLLQAIAELTGTDGEYFLPVLDRGHYSPGVIRQLPTGGTFIVGLPSVEFVHPWISDGQIEKMRTTYGGNNTLKHHITDSVGSTDVQTSNVVNVTDYNQLANLERVANGYKGFVSRFNIVEVL